MWCDMWQLREIGVGEGESRASRASWHIPSEGQGSEDVGTGRPGAGSFLHPRVRMAQEEAAGQPSPTGECWSQPSRPLWFIGECVAAGFVLGSRYASPRGKDGGGLCAGLRTPRWGWSSVVEQAWQEKQRPDARGCGRGSDPAPKDTGMEVPGLSPSPPPFNVKFFGALGELARGVWWQGLRREDQVKEGEAG